MGHQIMKQPDGKYAVWSTIVDDFILLNASPENIIEMEIEYQRSRIESGVRDIVNKLNEGLKPYFQFTMSFEEAMEFRNKKGDESNDN